MRCPFATWRGPVPNMTPGAMSLPVMGLVLHIEQGTESGTDSWFHNPGAQASAHFGNPKSGGLDQWVDTADEAWAEMAGNSRWISDEHEGMSGQLLTNTQITNDAKLLAWLHGLYAFPLQITDNVNTPGLGWHGMGGADWGGHLDCPGSPIVGQRQAILTLARSFVTTVPPVEVAVSALSKPAVAIMPSKSGNGYAIVAGDGGVFCYGDFPFHGSMGGQHLNAPMVNGAVTPTGNGYWLVAADGGVFCFGDAAFHGTPA